MRFTTQASRLRTPLERASVGRRRARSPLAPSSGRRLGAGGGRWVSFTCRRKEGDRGTVGTGPMALKRADFQKRADMRIREAKILLDAGEWNGAYYLTIYSVE